MSLEQQVYQELIGNGFSSAEAAGIMGNLQNESGFNPEARNPAGPQAGLGLAQWETTFYPQAAGWVTGNVSRDMTAQVNAITDEFRSLGLRGGSPGQVAGEWASQFEKCAGCEPGGAQYNARVSNAQSIFNQAQSGNWGSGPGVGGSPGSSNQAQLTSWWNPLDWPSEIADMIPGLFGAAGWSDMFKRLGLIMLGGLLILMGVFLLFDKEVRGFGSLFGKLQEGLKKQGQSKQAPGAGQQKTSQEAQQSEQEEAAAETEAESAGLEEAMAAA